MEKLERLEFLRSAINSPKHKLMKIVSEIEEIAVEIKSETWIRAAQKLSNVIWKLEAWQNSKH